MIDEQTKYLSEYRLKKADTLLIQAELLLRNHQYDGSVNRSYYAIFNAVRSVLALLRTDSRSHSGVISFFDRYFVKTGIFDKRFSKIFHAAFNYKSRRYMRQVEKNRCEGKRIIDAEALFKDLEI